MSGKDGGMKLLAPISLVLVVAGIVLIALGSMVGVALLVVGGPVVLWTAAGAAGANSS